MSGSKQNIASDLARVDAHVIQPHEYDEAPELDDTFFDNAVHRIGGVEVSREDWWAAEREAERAKVSADLKLDADVLEHFKATGPNWQAIVNAVLREAMEERDAAPSEHA